MQKPFFSIIVVSLNPKEELKNTVESILSQTCEDYEIIIKDGGSADGSLDFLLKEKKFRYLRKNEGIGPLLQKKEDGEVRDNKIKLIIKKDQGIYEGMNQALEEAKGEYFLFLNCGDYFYDSRVLEKTKKVIKEKKGEKEKVGIFYGNLFNRKQNSLITSSPKITDFTLYRNVPCHQVCFYHYSLFSQRGYKLCYRVRADYEHFLYCVKKKGAIGYAMDHVVASYEGGGFSETKENRKYSDKEHKEITKMYLKKSSCIKYRLILWLTLAPLRSKIAESPRLSAGYNKIKSLLYR